MDCLTETTLYEYIDGSLSNVKKGMVRDHLILCGDCKARYESYEKLEKALQNVSFIQPPEVIERNVLRSLFPLVPSYASIFAFMAASFLLMIVGIYYYFDFANNSLMQAYQLTAVSAGNWLGAAIKGILEITSSLFAIFKAANKFLAIMNISIGAEAILLMTLAVLTLGIFAVSKFLFKKSNNNI